MVKKLYLLLAAMAAVGILLAGCSGQSSSSGDSRYNYKTAEELKTMLEQGEALQILDIQMEDEYQEGHIVGSIATYAYPVKTEEEKAKLAAVLPELQQQKNPVVIVCPAGGGGAERTFEYLQQQGVAENRLFILENGWKGWPYPELTTVGLD